MLSGSAAAAVLCGKEFGILTRKHHCRRCGWAVCASCSEHRLVLDRWLEADKPHALQAGRKSDKPLRVCWRCRRAEGLDAMKAEWASKTPSEGVPPEPQPDS